jgi:hypothetical protein
MKRLLFALSLLTLLSACASFDAGYQAPEPPVSPMWHRSDRSLG